jgi:phage tail-like protein
MDANGLKFWALSDAKDWAPEGNVGPIYDSGHRTLRLPSLRGSALVEAPERAAALLEVSPAAVDEAGTYAFYDSDTLELRAAGGAPGTHLWMSLATTDQLSDLALGHDGVLYVVVSGSVRMLDVRERWAAVTLSDPALHAFRLAALPGGGAWVLDRASRALWRVRGLPFPEIGARRFDGDVFRPEPENVDGPRLLQVTIFESGLEPVAIATNSSGRTVVLAWGPNDSAWVQRIESDGQPGALYELAGVKRPFSVGWLDADVIVVLIATATGAEVVPFALEGGGGQLHALGGIYPLAQHTGGPFVHGLREPVHYPTRAGSSSDLGPPRALVRLSSLELAKSGVARNRIRIDAGVPGFVWHRLYLDAVIPPQCGVRVWLGASETEVAPEDAQLHLHSFGDIPSARGTPVGVWSSQASELAFHPGSLGCPAVPHRIGLFSVLVQRVGYRVSEISGRYLWVKVELIGSGRASSEIAALRVYGSRFSYVRKYLPSIYHETLFSPDSDAKAVETTPRDFLERMLLNFEGILTPLEDRIANAHLLTNPATTPEEALDWLGQWVGLRFDAGYTADAKRRALTHAAALHEWRGTPRGLALALDVVTGGGVSGRQVIVIEDFRLRRTFSTILGADLADEHDPLLAGIVQSGNSFVGDSLILTQEFRYEFLSLFNAELPVRPEGFSLESWLDFIVRTLVSSPLVDSFFDKLANRITVLVQQEASDDLIRMIERVLALEAPLHLQTQVVRATYPFIVGLASLVGVDTFLRAPTPPPALRVNESRIGARGFLRSPTTLDPRLEGGTS